LKKNKNKIEINIYIKIKMKFICILKIKIKMDSSNTVLNYGKYKGKTFDFVLQTDVDYCEWTLKQTRTKNKNMIQFQQWIKTKLK
jgi:hypothetical protein